METQKLLQKYQRRLSLEGWIRALLWGLIIGFAMNFLCSFAFWFFGIKKFWISIVIFAVGAAAATPIFYFAKFRPTKRGVASRVDALGLEERILTMAQLEDDDSYIARRQREDAMAALHTVNESLIKFAISLPLILVCAGAFLFGAGTTTASAVSEQSLLEMISNQQAAHVADVTFDVLYAVKNGVGGSVAGSTAQVVKSGENASPVQAIPAPNYIFVGWSDDVETDFRQDLDVSEDLEIFAIFAEADFAGEEDEDVALDTGNGERSKGEPGDQHNRPSDEGEGGTSEGGEYTASDSIIDGTTPYGPEFANSFEQAQTSMNEATDITQSESDVVNDYFHNIAK